VVKLALGRSAAWVAEYYPTDSVEDLGDGTQVVVLRARDEDWVRRLVLSLGDGVRILEPMSITERVRQDAQAALSAYLS
jgi:proteasome accessory factor C